MRFKLITALPKLNNNESRLLHGAGFFICGRNIQFFLLTSLFSMVYSFMANTQNKSGGSKGPRNKDQQQQTKEKKGMNLGLFDSLNHGILHRYLRRDVTSIHRRVQRKQKALDNRMEQEWVEKGRPSGYKRERMGAACCFYALDGSGDPKVVWGQ